MEQRKKLSLFSFHWNKNLIYAFIYWIIEIFLRMIIVYQYDNCFLISKTISFNEYIFVVYFAISNLLSGFLILYIKKSIKMESDYKQTKNSLIYKNPINKKNKIYYIKLIIISILELLFFSCYFIFFSVVNASYEQVSFKTERDIMILLDMIIRYILSIYINKDTIFKHHKWSIFGIIIGIFLIIPMDIVILFNNKHIDEFYSLLYVGVLVIKAILFPLEHTLIKKFYNDYYILPEYLLFSIGIIETIILTILTPILYFTVFNATFLYQTWNIITSFVYIFISFLKQIIIMKIIYIFSSQSVSFLIISTSIASAISEIIGFITKENKGGNKIYDYLKFFFQLLALIIIFFATMVYDEIIIVNRCGLNLNVKKGIQKRSFIEFNKTIKELENPDESSIYSEMIIKNEL